MKEIWKEIKGYRGRYQVSNLGTVRSMPASMTCRKKILKPHKSGKGYLSCGLSKDGIRKSFYIHRLVAEYFITNYDDKPQVNHIDGNKLNNCASNLEWCTPKENIQHSVRTGLSPLGKNHHSNKAIHQFTMEMEFVAEYYSIRQASNATGIYYCGISLCLSGKYKHSGGYIWKYK